MIFVRKVVFIHQTELKMIFTLKTKISTALKARPELKEILPAFHPAFKKLNNPILARTLTRLVTVSDAARIAGVSKEAMLAVMNTPGMPTVFPPKPDTIATPAPPWYKPELVQILDVRPNLESGNDPFAVIIEAVRTLPKGKILELIASFEPAPMIRLLSKQGWVNWIRWEKTEKDGETKDDCHVAFWFVENEKTRKKRSKSEQIFDETRLTKKDSGWILNVRGLAPPEPMIHVLETLERTDLVLPLTIKHQRVPVMLFPRLKERGCSWEIDEHDSGVDIIINKA